MNQYPLTFSIPSGVHELEFVYWMRPFTVEVLKTRYKLNIPFSCLYIQLTVPYESRKMMNADDKKLLSFAVTPSNLDRVQEMFEKVETWFTDEGIKELYGVNDSGLLMFNMEYKDLSASCVDEFAVIRTSLKIVPAPIEIAQGKMEPGAVLFINRQSNAVILRGYQVKNLCRFFKKFDFIKYDRYAMDCFQYSLSNQNIITGDANNNR